MSKISLGVTGILFVILGIVCISNPVGTLYAGAWIIGLLALIAGIFNLIFTLRTQHFLPNSASRMLSALLEIFVGIIVLTHKAAMTAFLPMIVAVWVMVESLSLAIDSFDFKKARFRYWWAFLLLGIAGTVLGSSESSTPSLQGQRFPRSSGSASSRLESATCWRFSESGNSKTSSGLPLCQGIMT